MAELSRSIANPRVLPPNHVVGQEIAVRLLVAALEKSRVTSAYCFLGPEGVGRSLLARWFAQALFCESSSEIPCGQCSGCHWLLTGSHPDLHWVSPTYLHQGRLIAANSEEAQTWQRRSPPQIRLEQVQAVTRFCARRPIRAQRSVVVMEGCETLAEGAANALLKTLEEPGLAHIILLAPQRTSLLPTLVSRCQLVPFRRLTPEEVNQVLTRLGYEELPGIPRSEWIALAQGSPGLALLAHEHLQRIPLDLLGNLKRWPHSLPQALELGRAIATHLDVPSQLWLIDYLQQHFWRQGSRQPIQHLEHIRRQLLQFVQPRLSWEMNLAGLDGIADP